MFLYAQDFFVKKMVSEDRDTNGKFLHTKHENLLLKRKCQFLIKFYIRVRQFRENVMLDIFARVKVSLVFSETSYTIKIKLNYLLN